MIGDPIHLKEVFEEGIYNYDFSYNMGFLDFSKWFQEYSKPMPNISSCHLISFTMDGIVTKSDDLSEDFSQWRENPSIEPFKSFTAESLPPIPPILSKPPLSVNIKLEDVPKISQSFYENLIKGGCGSSQPEICNPDTNVAFLMKKNQDDAEAIIESEPKVEEVESSTHLETNAAITGFGNLIWKEKDNRWELETYFENDEEYVYHSEYDCLVDSDGTMNEAFYKWSKSHPRLYNKFKLGTKSKEKSPTQQQESTKKNLGKVLGGGRGFRTSKASKSDKK